MKELIRNTAKNKALVVMALPAMVLLFMFSYMPMYALTVAFKNFNYMEGIMGSAWCGLNNFKFLISSKSLSWRLLRNTVGYYLLFTALGTVANVGLALLINECASRRYVKVAHTVMIMPTFISWIAVTFIVKAFLNTGNGLVNHLLEAAGLQKVNWYLSPKYWPVILSIITLWKGTGYGSIIYLSALAGMDAQVFEAADLDGATKLQKIRYITLPMLTNLISIKLLLSLGGIMTSNTGLFYRVTLNTGILYSTTQTIDAYIMNALTSGNSQFGMIAAATLFQSAVGAMMLLLVNFVVRKVSPENALF
ncbi:MAG: ABC transporter permease subunit [Eubacteriales bacterium]|nr:ABC transporter permease subunit [Eubacteriales bacterium]